MDDVRGEGLLAGVKLGVPPADVVRLRAAEKLLIVAAADNVVRVLPPLTVEDDEIAKGSIVSRAP